MKGGGGLEIQVGSKRKEISTFTLNNVLVYATLYQEKKLKHSPPGLCFIVIGLYGFFGRNSTNRYDSR